jgi:hypothetical protein
MIKEGAEKMMRIAYNVLEMQANVRAPRVLGDEGMKTTSPEAESSFAGRRNTVQVPRLMMAGQVTGEEQGSGSLDDPEVQLDAEGEAK